MEKAIDQATREVRRLALENCVQQRAASQPLVCPLCKSKLNVEAYGRSRTINSSFGAVDYQRDYGFCLSCAQHAYPADAALGLLHQRATASPRVQELAALHALRGPTGQYQEDFKRITGLNLDPRSVHREACRQGQRAASLSNTKSVDAQVASVPTRRIPSVTDRTTNSRMYIGGKLCVVLFALAPSRPLVNDLRSTSVFANLPIGGLRSPSLEPQ
jgi:hypothetical protein